MIRVLALLALIILLALGAAWIDDHPGTVSIVWLGQRVDTSVAVALIGLVIVAAALMLLWSLLRLILRAPSLMALARRTRRRARGYDVVSRGMVAVGAGDQGGAKRFAGEARKLLGEEPLTLLLEAQSAQLSGDRGAAEAAFRRMTETPQTKLLGLRGLFIEAKRKGDADAARAHAEDAVRLAPSAGWANEAVLTDRTAAGDWAGARGALERAERLRVLDKATGARQRAVLLTAEALALAEGPRADQARELALEAHRLAPSLVPAAVLAGRLHAQRGDLRKAAKVLEAAWDAGPHPDIAEVHLTLRSGDSALDRLARARGLQRLKPADPESALIYARAAIDAREFAKAREALAPLIERQPTRRTCLLMAELEDAEFGAKGKVRAWLARASRAPRDPAWVADGFVSDTWAPVSPVSGRLDAFVWMVPPERLSASHHETANDVIADADEAAQPEAAPALPAIAAEPAPKPEAEVEPPTARETPPTVAAETPTAPPPAQSPVAPSIPQAESANTTAPSPKADLAARSPARPTPVVFPVPRAPDDPGAEAAAGEAAGQRPRFRLLG